jgi:hypothetical protein
MNHTSKSAMLALTFCGTALLSQTVSPPNPSAQTPSGQTTSDQIANVDHSAPVASAPEPPLQDSETVATVSQVRIVRLSEVSGEVQLDRSTESGFEVAFANLPITQGARLRTANGVAEVEFEDNSSLRLTSDTEVEFARLGRGASGATASSVTVLKGTVYASLTATRGNEFTVSFGGAKAVLPPSSHIKLSVGSPATRLGVYEGNVQVETASGPITVGRKKELIFALTGDTASIASPKMVGGIEKSMFDSWDHDSVQYHQKVANAVAYGSSVPAYGLSDLNYYGNFVNADSNCGGGSMWRPYFTSAAWDPFSNGLYAYYPGAGYSFVSPYPWGWTPFHYGSWQYCPSQGWGWRPGGSWNGLTNTRLLKVPHSPARPVLPAKPVGGRSTILAYNAKPLVMSKLDSGNKFVFQRDSAGLGIPRQSFGNLARTSNAVAQHGSASTSVAVGASSGPSPIARPSPVSASTSASRSASSSASSTGSSGSSMSSASSHGGFSGSSGGSPAGSASSGGHH